MEVSHFCRIFANKINQININMQTIAIENVSLSLPNGDLSLLRSLARKMGWTIRRRRKSGIEKGLEDIRKGNVYRAENAEDLIKQILG